MTKRPLLVGGLLFAGFAVFAVPRHVRSIEADIASRTEAVLAEHDVAARVSVRGRDVYLSGRVPTEEARERALESVGSLRGVRAVVSELAALSSGAPPPVAHSERGEPPAARLRVEVEPDGSVVVSGRAPSAAVKDRWLAEVRNLAAPGDRAAQVRDELEVAGAESSGPAVPDAAIAAGIGALRQLEEGRLSATASRLRVSGRTADPTLEARLLARLRQEVASVQVSVDIHSGDAAAEERADGEQASRNRQTARVMLARGRNGSVVVSGLAPDAAARDAWLDEAADAYPDLRIEDRLRIGDFEIPAKFGGCVRAAVPWLGRLLNGRIDVAPSVVRVFGKARTPGDADRMREELQAAGCAVDAARLQMAEGES